MVKGEIRRRKLPYGWYPDNEREIKQAVRGFLGGVKSGSGNSRAVIAPHAGWYFSGKIGAEAISSLDKEADTVVVIGGHLHAGSKILVADEDYFETPAGNLKSDAAFTAGLRKALSMDQDRSGDNTVEIHLPMIKVLFPDAELVWLRVGPGPESITLGNILSDLAGEMEKNTVVIGSTDLTHYGRNYLFAPEGSGKKAVEWVKNINDAGIITEMLAMNPDSIIEHASLNRSACSAGAAAAAVAFALKEGKTNSKLIDYYTSYDISPGDSFVGYCGICYS